MPIAEQRSPPLLTHLDVCVFLPFPQYESSLPQDIPPGSKVYLIHFDKPLHHARHYVGFSEDLPGRIHKHRMGQGAAFMRAIAKKQISWHVSRIWDGDRAFERMLKDQHNASHLCQTCIQDRVFEKTVSVTSLRATR
jgi:predicted GIY-YIG superfamily endonuclease